LGRYELDDTVTFVAVSGGIGAFPVGTRLALGGNNVCTEVARTGLPARIDNHPDASGSIAAAARERGIRSSIGAPIVVEGRLWGVMVIGSGEGQPPPLDVEESLGDFTELLATAIANIESRAELAQLAEEQAALRRIATLVARGEQPEKVFAAATREVARLFSVDYAGLGRYGPDRTVTHLAAASRTAVNGRVGVTRPLGGKNLNTIVYDTSRPVRLDTYNDVSGPYSSVAHTYEITSSAGAPIIVDGRLWGVMGIYATMDQPIAAGTEARLASFTELLATAIANAESRAELDASRVRIVAAGDEMRRRIERDLHDGAQQQLVSLMLELKKAEAVPCEECGLHDHIVRTGRALADVLEGLQEISRGIHPAVLSKGGLGPALKALSRRSAVPVVLDLRGERRLPEYVEVAAYYVASEALANAVKHASASLVTIELDIGDQTLRLQIRDDGVGGADPSRGSGLVGLADRIEALGGRLELTSPAGQGTAMSITVPVE
jgi:signal transduction histidine kinase